MVARARAGGHKTALARGQGGSMRLGKNAWMLGLAVMMVASSAVAAETDQPAVAPEQAELSLETVAAETPDHEVESFSGTACEASEASFASTKGGGGGQPFNCSCECTCPASGAFEVQTFTLPAWTNRSCESFDGDACSIGPFDTCNTVRRYDNCVTL